MARDAPRLCIRFVTKCDRLDAKLWRIRGEEREHHVRGNDILVQKNLRRQNCHMLRGTTRGIRELDGTCQTLVSEKFSCVSIDMSSLGLHADHVCVGMSFGISAQTFDILSSFVSGYWSW